MPISVFQGSKMRQTLVKMGVRAMSKVDAPKMGFDKGFQKYYNYYTIQGRYGVSNMKDLT